MKNVNNNKPRLERGDLKVGRIYRAKKPQAIGFVQQVWNDRQILSIGPGGVQYDSPSVKNGARYPTVPIEKFLKWASSDVTDITPEEGWSPVNPTA